MVSLLSYVKYPGESSIEHANTKSQIAMKLLLLF
jgi:hypothetical protein